MRFALTVSMSVLAVALSAVLYGQSRSIEPARIAYVSAQRILRESPAAKAASTKVQTAQRDRVADIRKKQGELEATRRELAAAKDAASRSTLQKREEGQRMELERATAEARSDLQTEQRELQGELQRLLGPVLTDIAHERNLQAVLNADFSVMWGVKELDLTREVIERLNKGTQSKEKE